MIPQSRSLPQDGARRGCCRKRVAGQFSRHHCLSDAFLFPETRFFWSPAPQFVPFCRLSRRFASRYCRFTRPGPPPLLPPPAPAGLSSLLRRPRCRPLWQSCRSIGVFSPVPWLAVSILREVQAMLAVWGAQYGGSAQLAPPTTASASWRSIGPRGLAGPVPPRAAAPVYGTLTPPSASCLSHRAAPDLSIIPAPASPISIVVAFPWPLVRYLIVPPSRAHQTSVIALWPRPQRLFGPDITHNIPRGYHDAHPEVALYLSSPTPSRIRLRSHSGRGSVSSLTSDILRPRSYHDAHPEGHRASVRRAQTPVAPTCGTTDRGVRLGKLPTPPTWPTYRLR